MATKYQHKRSWRNLLLNRGVQLRFTLFLCGLAGVLMAGLGWWVMRVADRSTEVGLAPIQAIDCEKVAQAPANERTPEIPAETLPAEEPAAPSPRRRKVKVKSSIEIVDDAVPAKPEAAEPPRDAERYNECIDEQAALVAKITGRRDMIFHALWIVGVVILFGLFFWGIKMTHKLAGPLYKMGTYFEQIRDGHYGGLHNLRRGDQLIAFYDHFKEAHAGLRRLQEEDIEELKSLLSIVQGADLKTRAPEAYAAMQELEILLKDKEASIASR